MNRQSVSVRRRLGSLIFLVLHNITGGRTHADKCLVIGYKLKIKGETFVTLYARPELQKALLEVKDKNLHLLSGSSTEKVAII